MSVASPYAVLDLPDWEITKVDGDPADGRIRYRNDDRQLCVNWRAGHTYNDYLQNRRRIGPATSIVLLGQNTESWDYQEHDHTAIRPVQGTTFLEVRGEGMDRKAFVDLLDHLRPVESDAFEATLPGDVVRPGQIPSTVDALLSGVSTPDGFNVSEIHVAPYQEPYHVTAAVTGSVGCSWIDQYTAARSVGDSVAEQQAVDAMSGSRHWPALHAIEHSGGWSEQFWSVADDMAAGTAGGLHGRICLHTRQELESLG